MCNAHMKIIFGRLKGQGPQERTKLWAASSLGLLVFENELKRRGSTFFGGSSLPGYLDYMIWPWMERINIFPKIFEV